MVLPICSWVSSWGKKPPSAIQTGHGETRRSPSVFSPCNQPAPKQPSAYPPLGKGSLQYQQCRPPQRRSCLLPQSTKQFVVLSFDCGSCYFLLRGPLWFLLAGEIQRETSGARSGNATLYFSNKVHLETSPRQRFHAHFEDT